MTGSSGESQYLTPILPVRTVKALGKSLNLSKSVLPFTEVMKLNQPKWFIHASYDSVVHTCHMSFWGLNNVQTSEPGQ